jgi:hypothetical protein
MLANKILFMQDTINLCVKMGAGALARITELTEYGITESGNNAEGMNGKVLFDGRNLYRGETPMGIGF